MLKQIILIKPIIINIIQKNLIINKILYIIYIRLFNQWTIILSSVQFFSYPKLFHITVAFMMSNIFIRDNTW